MEIVRLWQEDPDVAGEAYSALWPAHVPLPATQHGPTLPTTPQQPSLLSTATAGLPCARHKRGQRNTTKEDEMQLCGFTAIQGSQPEP